jgi:glycogen synthase kinase 3 beta
MNYYNDDLYALIRKRSLNASLIKIYMFQIFKSLLYLSTLKLAHRDLKPHNILIDKSSNKLVICDFGSAKKLVIGEPNLAYICSRCYRAPELIFGSSDYTCQIDMWSIGCILI